MKPDVFDAFCDRWLGRKVTFKFMGRVLTGEVVEAMDTFCARHYIVVKVSDRVVTGKFGMPIQAAKRID